MSQILASQSAETLLLATFFVRDTLCGLDAAAVQEVIRFGAITPVRHSPPEVAGIVNLRGKIVTIVDVGLKFGLPAAVAGSESRVFIIEDRNEFIGLLVDRVGEVVETDRGQCQPLPANVARERARYLKGVCRAGGRVIAVVDAARILAETAQ